MKLQSVRVDRYGPLSGIEHEFDGGLEVCYGPNESGKTLLLDAILRLCSPDAVDVLPDVGRVEEQPVGHAVLETGGAEPAVARAGDTSDATAAGGPRSVDEHVLGDGTTLGDVTDCTPRQLRNVFVVRDADLRLDDEHEFYDATARRLADLHTAEIDALRKAVVDAGRLTPTTLNLARADEHGNVREVRDEAADLAERIDTYVTDCRASGVESAERERVEVATELERAREALERQQAAEALATYERLSAQLETVREATATLADRDATEAGLDRLESIDGELDRIADDLDAVEERRDELRAERQRLDGQIEDLAAERGTLADRLAELDAVEDRLERYRETVPVGADGKSVHLGAGVAIAGALGAGAAAIAGVLPAALGLTALAVLGGAWTLSRHRAQRRAQRERESLLAAARDAGIDTETAEAIAPAIRDLRDERDRLTDRLDSLEQDRELAERRLDDVEAEREDAIERRRTLRSERRELLREAGVPDVERYRAAVADAESLLADRREAMASLAERFGEPDRESPAIDERIDYWADELAALRDDVDAPAVDAEAFDPEERDRLESTVAELEDRRTELRNRLDDHEATVDRFADELGRLPTGRFRDEPIGLAARSVAGLAATARALESFVAEIERDADVSRVAVAALEDVRADEEAKLAALFGDESTAARTFASITDGRYEGVRYDPSDETLVVDAADGTTLTPRDLSRGTTDQLYLAARIGLADRLLPGEPGFLLLDDPLLPADPDRLAAGFDALRSLADAGWQIVYWTAKPEVGERLVERHDVARRRFEQLE
ncbi:hypothetical protein GCM10028857_14790 [Salinarchaeum chitinilyticum]